jgi:hypothetical protein
MALNPPKTLLEFPLGGIYDRQIEKSFPADGLETLHIDAKVLGNMLLCFDAEREASIVAAGDMGLLPQRIEREGDTLILQADNLGAYAKSGQKQKILVEVHVPRRTNVEAAFTGGVLILNGGEGDLTVNGKFGEVSGITHARKIEINLGGGDVSLNEIPGEADIHVSLGSSTLGWSELRGTEHVRLHCGFGGVDLVLPPGIAPVEDQGGMFKEKRVTTPEGTDIYAKIGFGGLDVFDWAIGLPED